MASLVSRQHPLNFDLVVGPQVRISAIVNTRIGHREHSRGIGAKRRGGRLGLHRSGATLMVCSGPGVDLLAA